VICRARPIGKFANSPMRHCSNCIGVHVIPNAALDRVAAPAPRYSGRLQWSVKLQGQHLFRIHPSKAALPNEARY
jgi:hypothetical protein